MDLDITHLRQWIGREQETVEVMTPRLANSLDAVLDGPAKLQDGDFAPVGIHWCIGPEIVPMHTLGADGHPQRGDFLPPVPLPRRMWAGGRLAFAGQFQVGQEIRRLSRIHDITAKLGTSGHLCFVAVTHDYASADGLILQERHDIVYRDGPVSRAVADAEPAPVAEAHFEVVATQALLQRYSAAMLNGHRIHYDRDYARDVEGYPALVVHGPLQATFLLVMATRLNEGRRPRQFTYRARRPLFDGNKFSVNGTRAGERADLWVANHDGALTMSAAAL